ncbi:MAG: hypothetical protein FJ147_07545 [Deltaproteobacteria bacterium]|nr:hypothetical protein [Deltaproteobacteria bacterium]
MAQLTVKECDDIVQKLVDYLGFNQFYEKLIKANAVVSRKRPSNVQALATQLYQLSAGLRREHPARYAVEVLWQDMLSKSVNEEQTKAIEALIEKVNTCLTPKFEIIPEKTQDLVTALGDYHRGLATLTNDEVAYMEMLLRATGDVARFLRERRTEVIEVGAKRASEAPKDEVNEPAAESGS